MSITQSIAYGFFITNTSKQILPRSHTLIFNPISDIRVLRKHADTIRCLQYSIWQHNNKMKRNFVVSASAPPDPSSSSGGLPGGLPGSWKNWLLGIVVTVIIPLLTNRWGTLLNWTRKNEDKIESTIQTVEDMVEAVEEVAEKVDKLTEDIIEDLPEGKLKIAVGRVEQAAEKVAKDAKQMDNMIDKVQEAEEKLDAFIEAEQQRTEAAKKDKETKDKK